MLIILALVLILVPASFAQSVTQTDWSGSDGIQGPILDWKNNYYSADNINGSENSLHLASSILADPMKNLVDGSFPRPTSVYAMDINGDGRMDIVAASEKTNKIVWWENTDGAGTAWIQHTVDSYVEGASSAYATDLDGDGDADILGASFLSDTVMWWENTNGTGNAWTKHTVDSDVEGASCIYTTDIDSDGDTDILGAASLADRIIWWENVDGKGKSWTRHTIKSFLHYVSSVYATDVDGDGDTDILGTARHTNKIAWWENINGIGTEWSMHRLGAEFYDASSVYATDLDGDGDTDILGAASAETVNSVVWWENVNGNGKSWTKHAVSTGLEDASFVYATDIDKDDDADILVISGHDNVSWLENTDGTAKSWTKHTVAHGFGGASSLCATDIDGNGTVDILGAAWVDNDIAWWDLAGYSDSGTLESSILYVDNIHSWNSFHATREQPDGTSLGFQFRSSTDPSDMGAWSSTVYNSSINLSLLLSGSTNFLQYKVILRSTNPKNTSTLSDITFTYNTSTDIDDSTERFGWNFMPIGNPSVGSISVQVSLPQSTQVDIFLHDITGRLITRYSSELSDGTHSVSLSNIAQGVYFCTMQANDFTATERIIVIE